MPCRVWRIQWKNQWSRIVAHQITIEVESRDGGVVEDAWQDQSQNDHEGEFKVEVGIWESVAIQV